MRRLFHRMSDGQFRWIPTRFRLVDFWSIISCDHSRVRCHDYMLTCSTNNVVRPFASHTIILRLATVHIFTVVGLSLGVLPDAFWRSPTLRFLGKGSHQFTLGHPSSHPVQNPSFALPLGQGCARIRRTMSNLHLYEYQLVNSGIRINSTAR